MAEQTSLRDRFSSSKRGMLLWHQERSILDITEMVCELMLENDVSRSELARRLGATKGYITQLLDGTTNMTVRTISDVFTALGYEFHPACRKIATGDTGRFQVGFQWNPEPSEADWLIPQPAVHAQ
jgi:transcriptional regulator with XRE-family HTH domain